MIINQADQVVTAQLNALADGNPVTTGTTSITVVKDGVGSPSEGIILHVANGLWTYFPTQEETNALHLAFVFANVLAGTQTPQMYTEKPYTINIGEIVNPINTIMDDFKLRFPFFDTATVDAILPSLIEEYQSYYCKQYNLEYKAAILQLLAHMYVLEIDTSDDPLRNLSSTSVDGVSESYESMNAETKTDLLYSTTKYGQKFLYLIQTDTGAYFV